MTKPSQALIWMLGFLATVALLAGLLATKLIANFEANPFFNGVILAVLAFGIGVNVRQVLLLSREVEWIELFKRSPPDRPLAIKPKLLAPMARMFAGRERAQFSLSTPSLPPILDSVYLRLEESRHLLRYLVPLPSSSPARHVLGPAGDDPLVADIIGCSASAQIRWRCSPSSRKT